MYDADIATSSSPELLLAEDEAESAGVSGEFSPEILLDTDACLEFLHE